MAFYFGCNEPSCKPEYMEQIVEDTLKDCGSVKISLACNQDLRLVCIAGDADSRNVKSGTGVIVSFVETKELQRPVSSRPQAKNTTHGWHLGVPLSSTPTKIGPRDVKRLKSRKRCHQGLNKF